MKENKQLDPPEIFEDLANFVIRAFYKEQHVVIFQFLTSLRQPVTDFEIANKLKLPFQYTIRALTQLSNDLLLHKFKETVKGNKDQWKYCIHYDTFLKVVKLRLSILKELVEEQAKEKIMGVYYYCKECNQGYDQIELMKMNTNSNNQPVCNHDDCEGEITENIEEIPLTQVMEKDLGHIFKLLKLADNLVVPRTSRSNLREIITKEEAERRNMIELKRQKYDQEAGSTSKSRIRQQTMAFLESGGQFEVLLLDEDQEEWINGKIGTHTTMKDNTPFFLRKDSSSLGMTTAGSQQQQKNVTVNSDYEFNQNFFELLSSSGNDFQVMMDEDEVEEEEEEDFVEEEENKEMKEVRNSIVVVVYVRGTRMRLEDIGSLEVSMMCEEEYVDYSKKLNNHLEVEW